MPILDAILDAVGRTPLVRLTRVVPAGCAQVLAKCEFLNPTGSIKDRMAVHILDQALREGRIRPGGTIVENTSGNTGLGVAMWAAVRGCRCVFTMPDKMSLEKVGMLKAFGAEVVITPTDVPGDSPQHYVQAAQRIARETPGAFYVNQYHSPWNIDAHELTTGPEILEQTEGSLDAVVIGAGTGGTISGVGRFLKKHAPSVRVIGVDPIGSVHYHLFHTGTLPTPHVYMVEGVGEDIPCDAMDFSVVDDFRQVSDKESFLMARRLVREEGLFCGGSSGSAVHGAIDVARELGPGRTVVTILPDSATRYTSKFLSDPWMKDHGFTGEGRDLGLVEDVLREHTAPVLTANATEHIDAVIQRLRAHGVSQLPILDGRGRPTRIVHEVDILRGLQEGRATGHSPVSDVARPIGGLIYPKARIEELCRIFETDQVAIVVDSERVVGVISQIDVIEFMAHRAP